MAELSFNEEHANSWKQRVEQEVADAKTTLDEVTEILKTCDESDDIMNGIKTAGEALTSTFEQCISTFNSTLTAFANSIGKILAGIQGGVEAAENYRSQHC